MNKTGDKTALAAHHLHRMSAADFASWGLQDAAYIKRVTVNDEVAWAIFAADGSHMGIAPERDLAFAAVRQHDLEPYSVH